jgi:hypothetical protein
MTAQPQRAMQPNPGVSPVTMLPLVTLLASAWLAAIVFYRYLPELLGVAALVTDETDWLRARRLARISFVIAGLAIFAIVVVGG